MNNKYNYVDRVLLAAVIQTLPCENVAELWRMINLQKEIKKKKKLSKKNETITY